jgi:hypothetical protein
MAGMRMMLKVTQALDKRSNIRLPFVAEAINLLEDTMPAILKVQHDLAAVSFNAAFDLAKSIRANMVPPDSAATDRKHE